MTGGCDGDLDPERNYSDRGSDNGRPSVPDFTPGKAAGLDNRANHPNMQTLPIMPETDIFSPSLPHAAGDLRRWSGLHGSSLSLAASNIANAHDGVVVLLTANT